MLKKILKITIRIYQVVSPALFRQLPLVVKPECKFHPTCSQYCLEALEKHGVSLGLAKGTLRIIKCNPLNPGGIDYV